MMMVAQRRFSPMVSSVITTTPAATNRADTSFTGLGNENSVRNELRLAASVTWLMLFLLAFVEPVRTTPRPQDRERRAGPGRPPPKRACSTHHSCSTSYGMTTPGDDARFPAWWLEGSPSWSKWPPRPPGADRPAMSRPTQP